MQKKSKRSAWARRFSLWMMSGLVLLACEAGPTGEPGEVDCAGGPSSGGSGGKGAGGSVSATGGISGAGGEPGEVPTSSGAGGGGADAGGMASGATAGAEDGGNAGEAGGSALTGGKSGGGQSAGGSSGTGGGGRGGGGSAGAAGSGGAAGGKGGSAGSSAICGNGTRETGEACDDGNKKDGDGCSALCRSKCEACQQRYPICKLVYDDCYKGRSSTEVAATGPAGGQLRADLCRSVTECIHESSCVYPKAGQARSPQVIDCYCGASSSVECTTGGDGKGNPQGPCVTAMQNAAETRDPNVVQPRLQDQDFASGRAAGVRLLNCELEACYSECVEDRDKTPCESCVVGSGENIGEYTCGGSVTCLQIPSCNAVFACARRTGCGLSGLETACYRGGQGPCAAEIKAYSGLNDPGQIASFAATFQAAMDCEATNCRAECFGAASSGGSGGAPSGGSAGKGGASGGGSGGSP